MKQTASTSLFAVLFMLLSVTAGRADPNTYFRIFTAAGGPYAGDGGPALKAILDGVNGLAVDRSGALYVAETGAHRVRCILPNGTITTVAGVGHAGYSGDGGPATEAMLYAPYGLALDRSENLYVADLGNGRIRRVSRAGVITTVAGGGTLEGIEGIPATSLRLKAPRNVTVSDDGSMNISDFDAHKVYVVSSTGSARTLAGSGIPGLSGDNGLAISADLAFPAGLAVGSDGVVYIADSGNQRIRKVKGGAIFSVMQPNDFRVPWVLELPTGLALNLAARLLVADGYAPDTLGGLPGFSDKDLSMPGHDIVCTPQGVVYFGSGGQVWQSGLNGKVTVYAGVGSASGFGDGGPPEQARLASPSALAADGSGNWYVADSSGQRVRRITAEGTITTVAGTGAAGLADLAGAPPTASPLDTPRGVAIGPKGEVYISDSGNHRVVVVGSGGVLASFAGTGNAGAEGLNGPAVAAQLNAPGQLAAAASGEVYIADTGNHRVVRVQRGGTLELVAGTGVAGYSGDGGPAATAQLDTPRAVALDGAGTLYIADTGNRRIRQVTPNGAIETLSPGEGIALAEPCGVAVSSDGAVLVTDCSLHEVFRIVPGSPGYVIAGNGAGGYSGDGGQALAAQLNTPAAALALADGSVLVADAGNSRVRRLTPDGAAPPRPPAAIAAAVVNAASFAAGPLAPGEMVSIFVAAPEESAESEAPAWQVRFDGRDAYTFGATAGQINVLVPYAAAGQSKTHLEILLDDEKLVELDAPLADCAPGVFTMPGEPSQILAVHQDGSLNSPSNPVFRGQYIVLYATGLGLTDPPQIDGMPAGLPLGLPVHPVTVTVGGLAAEVLYAGTAPGFVGLFQINVRVPVGYYSAGEHEVLVKVGDMPAQNGAMLFVR